MVYQDQENREISISRKDYLEAKIDGPDLGKKMPIRKYIKGIKDMMDERRERRNWDK